MRNIFAAFLCLINVSLFAKAEPVPMKLVHELDKSETQNALLVHAGKVFSSRTTGVETEKNSVSIFDVATDELKKKFDTNFLVVSIHAYTENSVIIMGRTDDPWQTHIQVLAWENETYTSQSFIVGDDLLIDSLEVSGTNNLVSDIAENALLTFRDGRFTRVPFDFYAAEVIEYTPSKFWVLEYGDMFHLGDEFISVVATDGSSAERLKLDREAVAGIVDLATSSDGKYVAGANQMSPGIVVFDASENKVLAKVATPGFPRTIENYGSCFVTMDIDTNSLNFYSADSAGTWSNLVSVDVSASQGRLVAPRKIATDVNTNKVYIRSAYPCPSCTVSQSSVFSADLSGVAALAACKQ